MTGLIAVNARTFCTDFMFNLTEPNRIIVVNAQPFDSGNYRCVARNDYSQAFAAEVISVEGLW